MKRIAIAAAICIAAFAAIGAQDILTADQFFAQVSERYAQVNDYEGRIVITTGKTVMKGVISFKAPSLMRIDFIQPQDQVICFSGDKLVVYLPEYRAILSQSVSQAKAGGAGMATREGLKIMKRGYTMAYESSPVPVPLEEGSAEMVVRLVLNRRLVSEGFVSIKLSISPDTKLIRRLEGLTVGGERMVFDFIDIKTNQGLPDSRFLYDAPASANVYNNFLFKSE